MIHLHNVVTGTRRPTPGLDMPIPRVRGRVCITIDNALMKLTERNWYRPVYYTPKKLPIAERIYSTTEPETLGMIYSVNILTLPIRSKICVPCGSCRPTLLSTEAIPYG